LSAVASFGESSLYCLLPINPRWERRLLKFLKLSGVGRIVADGTAEDEARAQRMDNWIISKVEEERTAGPET
jgi:hypothetical protein